MSVKVGETRGGDRSGRRPGPGGRRGEETAAGGISVRGATPSDADSIASVLSESFVEYRPMYTPGGYAATTPTARQIRGRWDEGPVWVAVGAGSVVGTVSAVPRGRELYVRSMAIVPAARGRRVGESLLGRLEEFARASGCARLSLTTTPFLSRAIRLYERAGFRRSERGPLELFGTPLFEMVKDLRGEEKPEEGRTRDRREALGRIRGALASPLARGAKAERVAESIRLCGDYRWVGVYDVRGPEIVNVAWSGHGPPAHPRFPADRGLSGEAVATGRAVVCNDVLNDPRYLTAFGSTRSEIVVPVARAATGEVVGTLDAEAERADAFSDADREFLEECAREAAGLWE